MFRITRKTKHSALLTRNNNIASYRIAKNHLRVLMLLHDIFTRKKTHKIAHKMNYYFFIFLFFFGFWNDARCFYLCCLVILTYTRVPITISVSFWRKLIMLSFWNTSILSDCLINFRQPSSVSFIEYIIDPLLIHRPF